MIISDMLLLIDNILVWLWGELKEFLNLATEARCTFYSIGNFKGKFVRIC